jgi:putative hydrolase of HD superfamily
MTDKERLQRQIDFLVEADKEKNILRQTRLSGHGRRENDAEHAWHMALTVYLLREYANEPFDVSRAILMALIHDLVEIDAGDTYAYDPEGMKTQAEREEAAARRIFGILPPDQEAEMHALFREFEEGKTPEARFAKVADNFQPLLLNCSNGGSDWAEHGVGVKAVRRRHQTTRPGSEFIWQCTERRIRENVQNGNIIDDESGE